MASNIKIKPSKVGSLRSAMHAKKGQKLSISAMKAKKKNASPAMKKKLTFAINARGWKHPDGGVVSNTPIVRQDLSSESIEKPDYTGFGINYMNTHIPTKGKFTKLDKKIYERVPQYEYPENRGAMISAFKQIINPKDTTNEDLLRLYGPNTGAGSELFKNALGYSGPFDYIEPSLYKPSKSKDKNSSYVRIKDLDEQEFLNNVMSNLDSTETSKVIREGMIPSTNIKNTHGLASYTISRGEDENGKYVSYYDKYDFNKPIVNRYLDNTPEIYDRVYYQDNPDYNKYKEYDNKIDSLWDIMIKTQDKKYYDEIDAMYELRNDIYKNSKNKFIVNKSNKKTRQFAYGGVMGNMDYYQDKQTGQNIANAAGSIPIVGLFKGIGEGVSNAIAPEDEYGVRKGSNARATAAGFFNPLSSTTSAFGDVKHGKVTGETALKFIAPFATGALANQEAKQAKMDARRMEGQLAGAEAFNAGLQDYGNGIATFAMGGTTGVNAEIEKGEVALSPNGEMEQYDLASHENTQGDNFKSFMPGTEIFSDRLKFKDGVTFAKQASKYKKILDKADKTLTSKDSTNLQKSTAKLNKENMLRLSQDLFNKQQAMGVSKQQGTGVPKAWAGIKVPPINYAKNVQYSNDFDFMGNGLTSDVYGDTNIKLPSVAKPLQSSQLSNMPSYNQGNKLNPNTGISLMGRAKNVNWGKTALGAASMAPMLYNLGSAIFNKPEKVASDRYYNPYTSQIRANMANRRYNIDPILASNRAGNAIYNRNVMNSAGGNRALAISNMIAGLNARHMADAGAYSQQNNINNQYLGEQAQMDYSLGAGNAQALAISDDINARNTASRRNYLAAAASGAQQYGLNKLQMRNQLASQNAYLKTLGNTNPYFNQWLNLDYLENYN
jgi:hypothetical protein